MGLILRITLYVMIITLPFSAAGQVGMETPKKTRQAFKALKPLAEQGNPVAQHELGVMYRTGQGVAHDYGRAARWFRKAADQGMPEAQNNIGGLYATGQGVEKDYVQAYKWFSLAAAQGLADAKSNRERLAMQMSAEELAKGKKMAARWQAKKPVGKAAP